MDEVTVDKENDIITVKITESAPCGTATAWGILPPLFGRVFRTVRPTPRPGTASLERQPETQAETRFSASEKSSTKRFHLPDRIVQV